MFGICRSAIRHWVSFTHDDNKKDSAEANVRALSPSDFTSFSNAVRNKSSSSTIDMSGTSANLSFHLRSKSHGLSLVGQRVPWTGLSGYTTWVLIFLFFLPPNTEVLGNDHQIGQ
jgi:hypothetical protein